MSRINTKWDLLLQRQDLTIDVLRLKIQENFLRKLQIEGFKSKTINENHSNEIRRLKLQILKLESKISKLDIQIREEYSSLLKVKEKND